MPKTRIVAVIAVCMLGLRAGWSADDNGLTIRVDVRPSDLLSTIGANWLSYNGDYTGRRYSSLSQITPQNVHQLQAQWVFHSPNSTLLQGTPVVVDGLMFVGSAN